MCFVGNFRHMPNPEAVEWFCREVLPLVEPDLLERHPFAVLGNWLDRVTLDIEPDVAGVDLVGWVPSVRPYVERSRLTVVPLLHGAGVKRKVIESMMAGTPVVTTPVGAEGLELEQGRHALIAADAADMAAGVTRLLGDDDLWHRLVEAGADHVEARHGIVSVQRQFDEIVERVMARPSIGVRPRDDGSPDGGGAGALLVDAVRERVRTIVAPARPSSSLRGATSGSSTSARGRAGTSHGAATAAGPASRRSTAVLR
jgi:hypothetical protein